MKPQRFTFKRDGQEVSSVKTCPVCDGSGLYTLEQPTCPQCDGKGLVWDCDYVQSLLDRIAELEAQLGQEAA